MKRLLPLLGLLLLTGIAYSQTPEKMSYQAVVRNAMNCLIANQQVGMRISILQGSATGDVAYMETHTPTTNENGLVSVKIGGGTPDPSYTGTISEIDWSGGPYFINTETDPVGGASYSITGTSQILCVPIALYAKQAERIAICSKYSIGDTLRASNDDPIGLIFSLADCGKICKILVAKLEDEPDDDYQWSNNYKLTKAFSASGSSNTREILSSHNDPPNDEAEAAMTCDILVTGPNNEYKDWFLPSKEELELMRINLHAEMLGDFEGSYWSSTECAKDMKQAWTVGFPADPNQTGGAAGVDKVGPHGSEFKVRAVHRFFRR